MPLRTTAIRATGDMDVWVAATPDNARKVAEVLRQFGFASESVDAARFSTPDQVVRMGVPPICIDVITSASGVEFGNCYARRFATTIDGINVCIIHIEDLKQNKKLSGRAKDLNDLENLP